LFEINENKIDQYVNISTHTGISIDQGLAQVSN